MEIFQIVIKMLISWHVKIWVVMCTLSRKRTQKKSPLRTVYKKEQKPKPAAASKSEQQQKIDAILDKISKSGYESLSKADKDFLFKAGKE